MENVTSWDGLRAFTREQEAIDLDKLSRGALIAMSYRLNDAIQAQFLPPLFTFLRLCNLHSRVSDRIKTAPVEYDPNWQRR